MSRKIYTTQVFLDGGLLQVYLRKSEPYMEDSLIKNIIKQFDKSSYDLTTDPKKATEFTVADFSEAVFGAEISVCGLHFKPISVWNRKNVP